MASAPAQAALLLYEGFDYSAGDLDGNGGWVVSSGDPEVSLNGVLRDSYDGSYAGVTTTGGYMYNTNATVDYASTSLASSVTSTFTDGSVTWLSLISVRGTNGAKARYSFAIGADALTGQNGGFVGNEMAGDGIGLTAHDDNDAEAAYWTPNAAGDDGVAGGTDMPGNTGRDRFTVAKITWSDAGNDTIDWVFFDKGDTMTEAAWNAAGKSSVSADLDQSTFDTLSFASDYVHFDEFRIATTFDDAVSGTEVIPEPTSLALLGLGGLLIAGRRRRRR